MTIKRGEIYWADLGECEGSEQGGLRPVLIIQNDTGNEYSPTIICAAISTKRKNYLPTHVPIHARNHVRMRDSVVLLEQIKTIDKEKLLFKMDYLHNDEMKRVNKALKISLEVT